MPGAPAALRPGHCDDANAAPDERPVIINCDDVGRQRGGGDIDWGDVRKAISHYQEAGYAPQGVYDQAKMTSNPPPADLQDLVMPCPVVDGCRNVTQGPTSTRVFCLRLAKTYNCNFVDNSNYRSSHWQDFEDHGWLCDHGCGLRISYMFDIFRNFIPASGPA